jgi:hypothetical protein
MRNLAFALPVLLLSAPALAAEPTNMITIEGSCDALSIAGEDLSDGCQDKVLQMIYDTGRVGLYAFSGDYIVTFSGDSDEVIGDEIHHQLDQIIIGTGENDIETVPARGTCIYGNPYEGNEVAFTCTAATKAGDTYELRFTTDGSTPTDAMAE